MVGLCQGSDVPGKEAVCTQRLWVCLRDTHCVCELDGNYHKKVAHASPLSGRRLHHFIQYPRANPASTWSFSNPTARPSSGNQTYNIQGPTVVVWFCNQETTRELGWLAHHLYSCTNDVETDRGSFG